MSLRISYTLTPLGGVSAGRSGPVGNSRAIHRVLPGSVVRGALGTTWWRSPSSRYSGNDAAAAFVRLFHEELTVGLAVPSWAAPTPTTATLIPMSWARCKYPDAGCADGSSEWLDRAADPVTRCPDCGGALEGGRGWREAAVPSTVTTRTALVHGVAATGQLFSRVAVPATVRYAGTLRLRGVADIDHPGVAWLLADKEVFVGGQLSTMGRCSWTATLAADDAAALPTGDVVVTLRAPAILADDFGLPTLDLTDAIGRLLAGTGGRGTVARVWDRASVLGGWNSVAGLPKPEEWVLDAGSTALVTDVDETGARALVGGIGLRRAEGFGETEVTARAPRLRVADPAAASRQGSVRQVRGATEQPLDPLDPLRSLVGGLDPTTQRAVLNEARQAQRLRDTGQLPAVHSLIARAEQLPWFRDLGPDTQSELRRALAADVRPLIELLLAAVRRDRS